MLPPINDNRAINKKLPVNLEAGLKFDVAFSKYFDEVKKFDDQNNVPRPSHWSGWNLSPLTIEFWLDGDSRIHERLKYSKDDNGIWTQSLLSP